MEAIFSSAKEQKRAKFLVGVLGILGGIMLWITVILDSRYMRLLGTSEISSYLSLFVPAIGLILIITGAGICMVFSISTPVSGVKTIDSADPQSDVSIQQNQESSLQVYPGSTNLSSGNLSTYDVKLGLIALIQSSVLAALYSGLVEEYQSNLSMQNWVRTVFPVAQYVFNWEAVLAFSTLLGLITVQFLPGRALAE